jgi:hypothetical protein
MTPIINNPAANDRAIPASKTGKYYLKRDVRLDHEMLQSLVFSSLSGTAMWVLLRLLQKRTWKPVGRGTRKKTEYNTGGLVFTYGEAIASGISQSQFHTVMKKLVVVGFLDVEHQGGFVGQDYSRYSLSDRWRNYGKESFKAVEKKRVLQAGLDVRSWQKRREKVATENRSYPTVENHSNGIGTLM